MVSSSPLSRTQTSRGRSAAPEDISIASVDDNESRGREQAQRRPSFSFLRRGKSGERTMSMRSPSGGKLTKRQVKEAELQRERDVNAIPPQPPKIPDLPRAAQLQTFGGENAKLEKYATITDQMNARGRALPNGPVDLTSSKIPPIPPIPGDKNGGYVDPYARTDNMTNRGRYSYASSAVSTINSPRRVRKRKDPTPFNILVAGARSSGKSCFLDFLRKSLALPARNQRQPVRTHSVIRPSHFRSNVNYVSHYLETEMNDGERIGVTLWDSEGLDKSIVDFQLREMSAFLESKFEETFNEEMKILRSPNVQDTHIHCVFLILDPLRLDHNLSSSQKAAEVRSYTNGKPFLHDTEPAIPSVLDEDFDLRVLRTLQGRTTVVPVISKADTVTTTHMKQLKRAVWDSLKKANLDPLEILGLDDDVPDDDPSVEELPFQQHKHSKRLDEHNEDSALSPPVRRKGCSASQKTNRHDQIRHTTLTSHLDDPSSSSNESSPRPSRLSHSRASSLTFPSVPHGPSEPYDEPSTPPYLPFSIISPDQYDSIVIGRKFAWGFADPYNAEHCDFNRLKDAVFKEWRGELKEASRELWYEGWRTSRLGGEKSHGGVVGIAR